MSLKLCFGPGIVDGSALVHVHMLKGCKILEFACWILHTVLHLLLLFLLLMSQAINPILEYIKRGLVRDRDAFQVHLQAILDRVSQQPVAGALSSAPANGATIITTNAELEVRGAPFPMDCAVPETGSRPVVGAQCSHQLQTSLLGQ